MPYDLNLADRVRLALARYPGCIEKKMFGGVGFILHGNMACGVQGDDLIVRMGVENNEQALSQPNVRPFMARPGKPMAGWVLVAPEGLRTPQELSQWVERGYSYATTLPGKS